MEVGLAKVIRASSLDLAASMKILTDYLPKRDSPLTFSAIYNPTNRFGYSVREGQEEALTPSTVCSQHFPVDELQEYILPLFDSRWKLHSYMLRAHMAQVSELMRDASVVSSLKNPAWIRVDIFGAEEQRRRSNYV